jgi:hypothetical protein
MTTLNKAQTEGKCSKCARYQKQIARFNKAFVEAEDERVRQSMQHEKEISKLNDACSYTYWLLADAKSALKRSKAGHGSGSQNEKALEKVDRPNSNANLRAPDSPYHTNKENDTKYGFAEDKDKHFDGDSSHGVNRLH